MTKTVHGIFDGKVLRPDEPVELEPNTRVRITIETAETDETKARSFLRTAQSLHLEGPSDWAARFEDLSSKLVCSSHFSGSEEEQAP
jgi:predicted DNA-binding antitoxin AbrB/MazE fold protein